MTQTPRRVPPVRSRDPRIPSALRDRAPGTQARATRVASRSPGLPIGPPAAMWLRRLRRFLRSPKGYLLVALIGLALVAAPSTGPANAATEVCAAVLSAMALELVLVRLDQGVWRWPSSALFTGLIIGMLLSAQVSWFVGATAGICAIAAKHLVHLGRTHVFNPAAVGLLVVFFLFSAGQSWWGAFGNMPLPVVLLLLPVGMVVAHRANKLPAALAFLGAYFALFTLAAYLGHAAEVVDVFQSPFVEMAVYCGFLMVTDPPTSPVPFRGQIWFGITVAAVSFVTYLTTHGLYYLLVGVLAGNTGYALLHAAVRSPRLRQLRNNPELQVTAGLGAAALGMVLVLLLAGGAIAFHQHGQASGDASAGSVAGAASADGSGSTAAAASGSGSAAPSLTVQDSFTGTVTEQDGTSGTTIDLQITGRGQRAVTLSAHLAGTLDGRGRLRVSTNQAVLSDVGGAQLCQGALTALSAADFTVACQGVGLYSGANLQVTGIITAVSQSKIEGDLSIGPGTDEP